MRCVERTYEYLDGLALVALLQANDLDAHLFDEHFVRQDWFSIIFYGGFRLMVPAEQLSAARELIEAFRQGALALNDNVDDMPACPLCCNTFSHWNDRPRDWIRFAQFLFWPIALLPLIFRYDFTHRYRCESCGHHWLERPTTSFAELQAQAETALNQTMP